MTRQQKALDRLTRRIEATGSLEGAFVIGSLARGEGDELSDVDVFVVVAEGRFDDAWAARAELEGGEAIVAWDQLEPGRANVGARKWLARDLVLVECLLTTPTSGAKLAEPHRLLTGPSDLAERVPRKPPIPREELEEYAQAQREAGRTHPIQTAYDGLTRAVRAALRGR
jgi:predicted nucleotidyltransferase